MADKIAPAVGRVAATTHGSRGTKVLDLRSESNPYARPHPAAQLPRRRLVALLAVSAGALATLAACGEKKLTRDNYDFPGARKDSTGNYQMRNAQ